MSKLSQTMKMVSGSTTYQIPFYTTTGEASGYGAYGTANVGGITCYYPLGTCASAATGSAYKTPCKVIKGSTTYYMLTNGIVYQTITVTQPFGGTITVNGESGTSFTVEKGSNVTLETTTDSGFDFYGWTGV